MERVTHGFDPEECPSVLDLDERDKEWVTYVIKRAGALFRDDQEQADEEEQVEVHDDRPVALNGR